MGWRTVADAVRWISSRLDPVPFDEAHPPGEKDRVLRQLDRLFDEINPIPWGPDGFKRSSEIDASTSCWCKSGRPH